jgi:hypothetical protein
MTELSIVPECDVDTAIIEILGEAKRSYNHKHGSGKVANELKFKLHDVISIGIIDEDKNKNAIPEYFLEFKILKTENNLILKKHEQKKQFLILICPEAEKWLLQDAKFANIDPVTFDLPEDLRRLKKITKTIEIHNNMGFYRFIKALVKAKAPSITTLKSWIELFKKDELDKI